MGLGQDFHMPVRDITKAVHDKAAGQVNFRIQMIGVKAHGATDRPHIDSKITHQGFDDLGTQAVFAIKAKATLDG